MNPPTAPATLWLRLFASWDAGEFLPARWRWEWTGLLVLAGALLGHGQEWALSTPTAPVGSYWYSVASSRDGTVFFAAERTDANFAPGRIHVSTDSGTNWVRTASPADFWTYLACSSDGRTLVATTDYGKIQRSVDGGATWKGFNVDRRWGPVGCSGDGRRMIVAPAGHQLQLSTDAGSTWSMTSTPQNISWFRACISRGGQVMAAVDGSSKLNGGALYISRDAGQTWIPTVFPESNLRFNWAALAMSDDGSHILLGGSGGGVTGPVAISTDTGATWTIQNLSHSSGGWLAATCSADGRRMVVAGGSSARSPIYSSQDAGLTWERNDIAPQTWYGLASSADGSRLVAVGYYNAGVWFGRWESGPPLLQSGGLIADRWLSWSAATPETFVLQQSPTLTSASWLPVATPPVIVEGTRRVAIPPGAAPAFYRLHRP